MKTGSETKISIFEDNFDSEPGRFLEILSNPQTRPAFEHQWLVYLSPIPLILSQSLFKVEGKVFEKFWNTGDKNDVLRNMLKYGTFSRRRFGVLFNIQGISLPGERLQINSAFENKTGNFMPPVIGGREFPTMVQTTLFETNVSFLNYFFRPWIIYAGHLGMVARDTDENVKTDMVVMEFDPFTSTSEKKIRCEYRYYNCVPTKINERNLKYKGGESEPGISIDWTFTHYSMK